ncbi:MAG: hypothetical protein A3K90_03710 [Pelodictyon luteolum]|jgi:cell division protein ZapA|uniref:Cell division protein ZapA n=1 Tax=Pelodictyon luteolum TaxID=1100 RepID=A0A165LDS5_PELLU|nr:cell division protein ZapA [Pelodictyon luteolum]KZK73900.1 MAG: hypothetical protein A3K90_03710 [Pelodictyon luteolum]
MEKFDVNVYGDTYPLRADTREAVEQAAGEVDRRMRRFAQQAPSFEPLRLAVLAAVELAEEKLQLEETMAGLQEKIGKLNAFVGDNLQ